MALTQDERKVLKLARKQLFSGESYFVCLAISEAGIALDNYAAAARLRRYVRRMLGSAPMLESWQARRGMGPRSSEQLRADRIAWIDWMLDQ